MDANNNTGIDLRSNSVQYAAKIISSHYGWVIVLITFVLTGLCFGGVGIVAVLLKPLSMEFGWNRGDISMAYTIASVTTAFAGVAFARIADLRGVRGLVALGSIVIAASLLLLSQMSSLWHLYAGYALFGILGFGAISIPMTATVTNWFTAHRGIAVGIATAGGAVGQGVIPYFATAIETAEGWRSAFLYLGLAYLLVALPLALLVRNPPRAHKHSAPAPQSTSQNRSRHISSRESLAWICAAVIFCCMCMSVPIMHIVAQANDTGLSAEEATRALTIVMLAGAIGRVIIGQVADRTGPLCAYMLASLGQTATVFWFTQVTGPAAFYLLAVAFGISFGGVMTSFLLTIRSLVPTRIAATSMSVVILFGWVGMGLGAYIGGVLFDLTQTYIFSFGGAAFSGLINLAILALLSSRLRRLRTIPAQALVPGTTESGAPAR